MLAVFKFDIEGTIQAGSVSKAFLSEVALLPPVFQPIAEKGTARERGWRGLIRHIANVGVFLQKVCRTVPTLSG